MNNTYEETYPTESPIEDKIKLLLVSKGYEQDNVHFRNGPSTEFDSKERYLRYGYWGGIEENDMNYITKHTRVSFKEESLYDEDCGWLYWYPYEKARIK